MRKRSILGGLALSAAVYPFVEARSPQLRRYQLHKTPGIPGLELEENPSAGRNLTNFSNEYGHSQQTPGSQESAAKADNQQTNLAWQLRILHLSDLHLWSGNKWLTKYVASLAEFTEIDFVALTGDNFCDASGLDMLRRALTPLLKLPGAFVFGSNDYYSGQFKVPLHYFFPEKKPKLRRVPDLPTTEFRNFLISGGWNDLNNQVATLEVTSPARQGRLAQQVLVALSGTDDPHIGRDEAVQLPNTWGKADLRLALTHAPYARVLDQYAACAADLVLAGHTHGGQVCLPGYGALVNNTDLPLAYSGGICSWQMGTVENPAPRVRLGRTYPPVDLQRLTAQAGILNPATTGKTTVHISRGLGTSKFTPVRLACPPEATILTISAFSENK
ncbi:metallophosphoesterase [Varibaculum vaginae]|uniref:metallophosphoesterase n=1 Tax=Varibaculum vaginae TaxID=2364797 RepID=UPI000F09534E|nr:metallophosphoesterase [Varibaculum vaginae]